VAYEGLEWFAAIDGSFIREYAQISYTAGRLAKVPILVGSNTDEGTSFGTTGTNTDEDCINQLICAFFSVWPRRRLVLTTTASKRWVLTREEATRLLTYYPNDPALGCPYGWGNVTWPKLGLMYKRYESMAGDLTMAAPRRLLAQTMAKYKKQVYSYRWDVPALNTSSTIGVGHFAEVERRHHLHIYPWLILSYRSLSSLRIPCRTLHRWELIPRVSNWATWPLACGRPS
jgi:triacylglycerol lipase